MFPFRTGANLENFLPNTQGLMCDLQVLEMLHSLATRVPKVILQRAEEIYSTLKEGVVSFWCLCRRNGFIAFFARFRWLKRYRFLISCVLSLTKVVVHIKDV
jgi:hypothetical protein